MLFSTAIGAVNAVVNCSRGCIPHSWVEQVSESHVVEFSLSTLTMLLSTALRCCIPHSWIEPLGKTDVAEFRLRLTQRMTRSRDRILGCTMLPARKGKPCRRAAFHIDHLAPSLGAGNYMRNEVQVVWTGRQTDLLMKVCKSAGMQRPQEACLREDARQSSELLGLVGPLLGGRCNGLRQLRLRVA